ncbi:zinc metalloprotease HtpX [Rhizohabitans arisaemae]|uniref:zinc metalloprotease HtpX n=1 Tax=Rhizohabitans arisaemae TaxID=2720610 RepID=UPI0024B0A81B|nr:zinc metalloprotease HtpX [Rhizohabitans arisaemae]
MHHHSGLRTAILLGVMSALVIAVGAWLGGGFGLQIALVLALAMNAVAYFFADRIALTAMRARPVSEVEQPVLYRIVRELSVSARQPMPRLYVSPTMQPNAFATGRSPRKAAICVTVGLVTLLDERELRGVVGHELAHVYNRDILLSSVAGALATMITWSSYVAVFFGGSDDEEGPGFLGALLLMILGPVAAGMIQMAISRSREFQADESGARLTGDPLALASALRKIEMGARARPFPSGNARLASASHLMIANPFHGHGIARLFSTHPATAERVSRLERMAGYRR